MKTHLIRAVFVILLCQAPANAIVLFGKDNTGNLSDPGTGTPWASVARLSNADGSVIGGSGIYLGNGYILTAAHVGPFASVTFDGSTFFMHDGVNPVQVGSTDMKILRLTSTPTVAAVGLYTGSLELSTTGTLVGWGVGRAAATAVNATVVPWGAASTSDKRWGTNTPKGTIAGFSYSTYIFDALQTSLGSSSGTPTGTGSDEAAASLYDSGSGMFQNIGGTWFLTGITSVVTQKGGASTSTYGNDVPATTLPGSPTGIQLPGGSGDINIFVRVSSYATQINTLIPEPSSLLLALTSCCLFLRRRR